MRPVVAILIFVLSGTALPAQDAASPADIRISVTPGDLASVRVSITARNASLLSVLEELVGACGGGLRLSVHPRLLAKVRGTSLPIDAGPLLLDEWARFIGGAIEEDVRVDRDRSMLVVAPLPQSSAPVGERPSGGYADHLWRTATRALADSLLTPGAPDALEAMYLLGVLNMARQRWEEASDWFSRFVEKAPKHDGRLVRALYLGGACGIKAPRSAKTLAKAKHFLTRISEIDESRPEVLDAWLLLARILIGEAQRIESEGTGARSGEDSALAAARLYMEARLRLDRILLKGRGTRTAAIALLLKAEIQYHLGEAAEAVATVETFDADLQRQHPDLAARLPFIRGLCLYRKGEHERAALALITAFERETDAVRRSRSGFFLARCYLALEKPLHALAVIKDVLNGDAGVSPSLRRRLLLLKARSELRLEAGDLAVGTLTSLLQGVDAEGGEDSVAHEAMHLLAGLLFEERRFEEARTLFERLERVEGLQNRARFMAARCVLQEGKPREALEILAGITADAGGPPGEDEIRRLRAEIYTRLGEHGKAALALTGWKEEK